MVFNSTGSAGGHTKTWSGNLPVRQEGRTGSCAAETDKQTKRAVLSVVKTDFRVLIPGDMSCLGDSILNLEDRHHIKNDGLLNVKANSDLLALQGNMCDG